MLSLDRCYNLQFAKHRPPTPIPPCLQLSSGKEVFEILQQMYGQVSQSTTAEIVEIANFADSESKLRDLISTPRGNCRARRP